VNGGRYNRWTDAYGVPIAQAARVEQIGVDPRHRAATRHRNTLGVVIALGSTRVAVRFDGEKTRVARVAPHLLHVVEDEESEAVGGVEEPMAGFHWHLYTHTTAEVLREPTLADRMARLAGLPDEVMRSPVSVAEWIIQRAEQGERWRLWHPGTNRWSAYEFEGGLGSLHLEVVRLAAHAHDIYLAASMSAGGRVDLFAEAVTVFDCPEGGQHEEHEPGGPSGRT
jgi:hypothetical protein